MRSVVDNPRLRARLVPARPARAVRKPAALIYGVEENVPLSSALVLGLQHALESASKLTLPIALLMSLGVSGSQLETMIVATLVLCGVSTALVASRSAIFGFGHLVPAAILSSFVSPAMLAAQKGGLPLVAGMTLVSGAAVLLLSRALHRWRAMFPAEVVGLIAFMVGASQASLAVSRFLGISRANQTPDPQHLLIATLTLGLLAGLTVWGKGRLRLFSSLITLAAGYTACAFAGMIRPEQWERLGQADWIGLPAVSPPGLAFDPQLILPFAILGLSASLKASGDLTIAEKISDADWKRTDLKAAGSAILSYSLGTIASALLGGFALLSSSSNVGLAAATGAAARRIGFFCGGILVALACFPKLIVLIGIAPAPVIGATFLLVVSYNLIAGMQIIMSRMMEARHTYIIGLSLLFGLSVDAVPGAYDGLPGWLRPIFASGLTLATTMVVMLNLLFRIGTSRKHQTDLAPTGEDIQKVYDFLEQNGAEWGARKEVVEKATSVVVEVYEAISLAGVAAGNVILTASFDEFKLEVLVRYSGILIEFQRAPMNPADLLKSDMPVMPIGGLLIHRLADRVRTRREGDRCEIELYFEH